VFLIIICLNSPEKYENWLYSKTLMNIHTRVLLNSNVSQCYLLLGPVYFLKYSTAYFKSQLFHNLK
jgi:hypothetical protein